ncbi:MAG TPA: hypothetical protein PLO78_03730 [Candidatus Omnitrophota bacterium]|nr:hypothetical protein [Candidatus Omnitrophota bacterium]
MKSTLKIVAFLLIFFCGFFISSLWAIPELKMELPSETSSFDKPVVLKLHFEWSPSEGSYEISSPEPGLLNLTSLKQSRSQESGNISRQTITYEFQPVEEGAAVIRTFQARFRRSGAATWTTVIIPEQKITIVKASLFSRYMIIGGILGIFVIIFVSSLALLMASLKSKASQQPLPPNPRQLLYAKAQETIAAVSSASPKEKLTLWSSQLRNVVIAYYDIMSKNATESEILAILKGSSLPVGEVREVTQLFEQLNTLRFSQQGISAFDLDRMQQALLQYIRGKIII